MSNQSSNSRGFGAAAAAATAVGSAMMPGLGALVGAAASVAGQAAVDAALNGPKVDLDAIQKLLDNNPNLRRKEGESFRDWVQRLRLLGFTSDPHQLRRLQLREAYTSRVLRDRGSSAIIGSADPRRPVSTSGRRSEVLDGVPLKVR